MIEETFYRSTDEPSRFVVGNQLLEDLVRYMQEISEELARVAQFITLLYVPRKSGYGWDHDAVAAVLGVDKCKVAAIVRRFMRRVRDWLANVFPEGLADPLFVR